VRWFANPMLDAYRDLLDRFPALWVLEPSFPNHLREFIGALNDGDEERAVLVTRDYYERVDSALARILRQGGVPARESHAAPKHDASTPQENDETVVPIRRSKGGP
jgi:hypothetical protein